MIINRQVISAADGNRLHFNIDFSLGTHISGWAVTGVPSMCEVRGGKVELALYFA